MVNDHFSPLSYQSIFWLLFFFNQFALQLDTCLCNITTVCSHIRFGTVIVIELSLLVSALGLLFVYDIPLQFHIQINLSVTNYFEMEW